MNGTESFDLSVLSVEARRHQWHYQVLALAFTVGSIVGFSFIAITSKGPQSPLDPVSQWVWVGAAVGYGYFLTNLGMFLFRVYAPSPRSLEVSTFGIGLGFAHGRRVSLLWTEIDGRGTLVDYSQRAGWPSFKSYVLAVHQRRRGTFLWGWGTLPWIYLTRSAFVALLGGARSAGIPIRVSECTPADAGTPSFRVIHFLGH